MEVARTLHRVVNLVGKEIAGDNRYNCGELNVMSENGVFYVLNFKQTVMSAWNPDIFHKPEVWEFLFYPNLVASCSKWSLQMAPGGTLMIYTTIN